MNLYPSLFDSDHDEDEYEPSVLDGYAYVGYGLFKLGMKGYNACVYLGNTAFGRSVIVATVFAYSKCSAYVEQYSKHIYNTNPRIKNVVDNVNWVKDQYAQLTSNIKREPNFTRWTNVCRAILVNGEYKLVEGYLPINFRMDISILSKMDFAWNREDDDVLISKLVDNYYVRLDNYNNLSSRNEPSLKPFISITYSHPNLKEDVELSIPDEMFRDGNQLFNFTFVYRCIQYCCEDDIPFDRNYQIKLMDSNVETHIVQSHQHVELYPDTFTIVDTIKRVDDEMSVVCETSDSNEVSDNDEEDENLNETDDELSDNNNQEEEEDENLNLNETDDVVDNTTGIRQRTRTESFCIPDDTKLN